VRVNKEKKSLAAQFLWLTAFCPFLVTPEFVLEVRPPTAAVNLTGFIVSTNISVVLKVLKLL